ncbi:Ig-like domain-containing protein, partial [Methylocucumis oryzae]|uniref:Ig-like domain-containing protein n=1 Tax=Methylocucumis oryzae TaxID=1632867 RepID=UPI000A490753
NDTGIVLEDDVQTGNVLANDSDPDGDELSVTAFTINGENYTPGDSASIPGIGTFTLNSDGDYTFTPEPDYHGPVPEITVTVSDGEFSTTSTLTLTVTPVSDIANDNTVTDEDTAVIIDVLANDSFEGSPVITDVTTPSHGTVEINADGTVTYTPNPGYTGNDSFTYTVASPDGIIETATVNVTVNPVNHAPTASNDTGIVLEDDVQTGNVLANDSDPDGDELSVTAFTINGENYTPGDSASIPGIGTFTLNSDGDYTFTPEPDYHGPVPEITVTVSDGEFSTTSTLTLTVTPVVDIADDNVTLNQDSSVTIDVLANDSFEGSPVITDVTTPSHGTVEINADGTVTYTPNPGYTGNDSFTYTVTSPDGITETATVNIVVNPVNHAPTASNDTGIGLEDDVQTGNVLANDSDPDGDELTVTGFTVNGENYTPGDSATIPGIGTFTLNSNGDYTFTPEPDYHGPVPEITVTVSDGEFSTTSTLTLTVTPVVDIADDNVTLDQDSSVTIDVLANDSFEGSPVITSTSTPSHGTVEINADGTVTYTPTPGYTGNDSFSYTVTSPDGITETATVNIVVNPVNHVPTASADRNIGPEDEIQTGNVLANDSDPDGDDLTVTGFSVNGEDYTPGDSATIPGIGTFTLNSNGDYTFTPEPDYHGPVPEITVTVSDGEFSTTSTLTLTVTQSATSPTITR